MAVKKKVAAKKAAPKKEAPKKVAKKAPAKKAGPVKVYHVSKRASDGKWSIKFTGGEKSIKLYNTKEEALAAAKILAENQGGTILTHASKGAHAGKIVKK